MQRTIKINSRRIECPDGNFRIPFAELEGLRFADIPFYSIVEVVELPASKNYSFEIAATHGGGQNDEFFEVRIHVHFQELKTRESAIQRHVQRIQKVLGPRGATGKWKEVADELRFNALQHWITGVSYFKKFTRQTVR